MKRSAIHRASIALSRHRLKLTTKQSRTTIARNAAMERHHGPKRRAASGVATILSRVLHSLTKG